MKKLITLVSLSLAAALSHAEDRTVLCVNRDLLDSSFVAKFKRNDISSVELFVPNGKAGGSPMFGPCYVQPGTDSSYYCDVSKSNDGGYVVRIFPINGGEFTATVTPWSKAGHGRPVDLPCDKAEPVVN